MNLTVLIFNQLFDLLHYLLLFCHAAEETEDILIYALCNCSCHQTITVLSLLLY